METACGGGGGGTYIGRRKGRTENRRIQRLLAWEYSEQFGTVLVESPFAETTRTGEGMCQVALALTSSRLIIAADILTGNSRFLYPSGVDPSIESLELISVYPLDLVRISVFRRRRRKALKTRLVNGRTRYFELGGVYNRGTYWKIWREEIERLQAKRSNGSSFSESSAASSSSTTTVYLISSESEVDLRGKRKLDKFYRIWAHFDGGAGDSKVPKWPIKDVYLGPAYAELQNDHYVPVPIRFAGGSLEEIRDYLDERSSRKVGKASSSWPIYKNSEGRRRAEMCDVLFLGKSLRGHFNCDCSDCTWRSKLAINTTAASLEEDAENSDRKTYSEHAQPTMSKRRRKDTAVGQRDDRVSVKLSRFAFGVPEKCNSGLCLTPCKLYSERNFENLMENGVRIWEGPQKGRGRSAIRKHARRYAFLGSPHFFYALGPWSVQPGERDLVQGRSASTVAIKRQPVEQEFALNVSRRQLTGSISCNNLEPSSRRSMGASNKLKIILFWTPDYWYRPRAAITAYRELRRHLNSLKDFHSNETSGKRKFFQLYQRASRENVTKPSSLLLRMFSGSNKSKKKVQELGPGENSGRYQLRQLLKMQVRVTAWDIDSTTLANQLTLIDRTLFLRIPAIEMEILIYQRSSRNAPNFAALIAFSHRICCLVSSEILTEKSLKMRARIIARFISAAKKCFSAGNFHSCRSIIAGMQTPGIYRLKNTWSHLRRYHANKYESLERLCKIFKNPRSQIYRKAWFDAENRPPYLPFIGDLLVRIFSPNLEMKAYKKSGRTCKRLNSANTAMNSTKTIRENSVETEIKKTGFKRILMVFKNKSKEKNLQVSWNEKEQKLVKKYVDRWRTFLLESKILAKEEEKLKNLDPRKKRILEISSWLLNCQKAAKLYDYPMHSLSWEFLRKTRYKEDRENFLISQKLEP